MLQKLNATLQQNPYLEKVAKLHFQKCNMLVTPTTESYGNATLQHHVAKLQFYYTEYILQLAGR